MNENSKEQNGNHPAPPESSPPDIETYDDAVIGKAFRLSLIVLAVLVVAGGGALWWLKRQSPAPTPRLTQLSAPQVPPSLISEIPAVRFTDITAEAGITFTHVNGAYGDKLLPESMGGGGAFFDFDNDGDQDLFFVNSCYWPGKMPEGAKPPTMALYQNDGTGHFRDVTAGSGLDIVMYGQGCAVGDYDNDGFVDIFISGVHGNRLFRNRGEGRFEDVTTKAGVGGSGLDWSTSCAFFDYDRDGDLDLFVVNYVQWSKEIDFEVGYKLVGIGRAYGQPRDFPGTFPFLYRNNGDGTFTDVSKWAGIQVKNPVTGVPAAKSLGVVVADLDNDGWPDLIVANDTVQNYVFHNNRDGTFKEIGALSGIAFDSYGQTRGAMGIDVARFRNDEALGVAIGNFANEMTALYVSQVQPLTFADEAITEGIGPASRLLLTFGIFFFDYDLDGRLDVLAANGHLETDIAKVQQSQTYQQPAQLFWNAGRARGPSFVAVPPAKAGEDLFQPIVGRGSAYADIDGDGDLDVVLMQTGGPPLLLRNDQRLGHRWVRFRLVGNPDNRDAIGAEIKLTSAGRTMYRTVMPTRGYLSQSELPVTFGLGNSERIDSVEVRWPNGKVKSVRGAVAGRLNVVRQAD
ncbi:MAG: VCBS repeat-containing protein [Verrucomicrobia bacterium]|nr:VCBS repeat-containing protein [Verrucomicrobiota bacterium]